MITGPIHHAQLEHDQPLFKQIWNDPEAQDRIEVEINNWQKSPKIWEKRFNRDGTEK